MKQTRQPVRAVKQSIYLDVYDICLRFLLSHMIFWVLKWLAPFGAKILSLLINPRHLAPKYFEHFIRSAPPLFILDPLLWIRSAYVSVYINSCFGLNKTLTNLTSLRQHHLQYTILTISMERSQILNQRSLWTYEDVTETSKFWKILGRERKLTFNLRSSRQICMITQHRI